MNRWRYADRNAVMETVRRSPGGGLSYKSGDPEERWAWRGVSVRMRQDDGSTRHVTFEDTGRVYLTVTGPSPNYGTLETRWLDARDPGEWVRELFCGCG